METRIYKKPCELGDKDINGKIIGTQSPLLQKLKVDDEDGNYTTKRRGETKGGHQNQRNKDNAVIQVINIESKVGKRTK